MANVFLIYQKQYVLKGDIIPYSILLGAKFNRIVQITRLYPTFLFIFISSQPILDRLKCRHFCRRCAKVHPFCKKAQTSSDNKVCWAVLHWTKYSRWQSDGQHGRHGQHPGQCE